ncbi:hypothetical protein ES703_24824 [subsurface metagenome]
MTEKKSAKPPKRRRPLRQKLREAAGDWLTYAVLISGVVIIILFVLSFKGN